MLAWQRMEQRVDVTNVQYWIRLHPQIMSCGRASVRRAVQIFFSLSMRTWASGQPD